MARNGRRPGPAAKYMAGERGLTPHTRTGYLGREMTMPDISQAEIGRRMYHVHRGKTVERAIKQVHEALGPAWRSLSEEEIRVLGHVLQCTWNTIDQKQWDRIPFGRMDPEAVQKILSLSEGVRPGHNPSPDAVGAIRKILLAL